MAGRSKTKFLDPKRVPLPDEEQGTIWATLSRVTQLVLMLCVVAAIVLWFVPIIQQNQEVRDRKTALQKAIASELEEEAKLTAQFGALRTNPVAIENEARDTLNMGRPGEVIFRFDPYQPELER